MAHRPYSEYYDDFNAPDAADRGRHRPTSAGWHALLCSLVGIGLFGVIFALGYLLKVGELQAGAVRALVFTIIGIDGVCFVLGLASLLLGIKALTPSNPFYRGYGTTGLVLGILLMLTALVVGFVFFCVGMFVEVLRGAGG